MMRTPAKTTTGQALGLATTAVLLLTALTPANAAHAHAPAHAPAPVDTLVPLDWVAMGDSFTAGVIPATGVAEERPRDGCERTSRSYPEVIEERLGRRVDLTNRSCGSATIDSILHEWQEPTGQSIAALGIYDPEYPFDPVPPQIHAVDAAETDVITVGIGGNDLDVGEIFFTCIELGAQSGNEGSPCRDHFTDPGSGTTPLAERLEDLRAEYAEMLAQLHERAPHARIVTVGYPSIVPADVRRCEFDNPLHFGTITHQDLAWLREELQRPLNAAISGASAGAAATTHVDLYAASRGHDVCAAEPWIEGLMTSTDPVEWALIHPNARGQASAADQVQEAIEEALHP